MSVDTAVIGQTVTPGAAPSLNQAGKGRNYLVLVVEICSGVLAM